MKTVSAIIAAFMSAIVIFGGAQRLGDSFDIVAIRAANDQQRRQNEQKTRQSPKSYAIDTTWATIRPRPQSQDKR